MKANRPWRSYAPEEPADQAGLADPSKVEYFPEGGVRIQVRGAHGFIADNQPNYHSEVEIQFFCQGAGAYFIHDRNYPFQKNSVLIMHGNEVHTFIPNGDSQYKKICLVFSGSIFDRHSPALVALESLRSVYHLLLEEREATIARLLLEEIEDEFRDKLPNWQWVAVQNVEKILVILQRVHARGEVVPRRENALIEGVLRFLEQNFTENYALADIARRFNISPYHLSREFKKYVGLGFKDYIIRRRIMEAKRLLEETDGKVASIAFRVGFEDLSSFYRNFKTVVGVSPSHYRKLCE